MGFINNTSYLLDAVLTKKGREYLAKSSGNLILQNLHYQMMR